MSGYRAVNFPFVREHVGEQRMNARDLELKPPENLAVFYAPKRLQSQFRLILAFDNRLAHVVLKSREPMIAQLKLAWWNDVIGRPRESRPSGEIMLSALGEPVNSVCEAPMLLLIEAWEVLAATADWTDACLANFAALRSAAIFGQYAEWVEAADDANAIGKIWALADLSERTGKQWTIPQRVSVSMPRGSALRPLTILALSHSSVSGPRLIWHALTGW